MQNRINDASKSEIQETEKQISESDIQYHSKINIKYTVLTIFSVLHFLKKCKKPHFFGRTITYLEKIIFEIYVTFKKLVNFLFQVLYTHTHPAQLLST